MIGERIHSYEINAHLGQGGMGNVFRATDNMLGREVALKMLHPQLTIEPLFLDRFKKEARILAQLLHPNIAVIYNFIEQGGNHFMVMEYVEGTSLDDLLKKYRALPAEFIVPVFIQALEGLQHAHRKNIFHRDIKPANLMITGDGTLKLMDFGIAKVAGEQKMTQVNKIIGTIEFMAPELIEGKDASSLSDIYSMGATLYELISGKVPFEGDTDFNMMQAILKSKVKPPEKFNPQVPKALSDIVLKSMDKNPEHRYPNARAFQTALINAFPHYREIDVNVLRKAQQTVLAAKRTGELTLPTKIMEEPSAMETRVELAKPLAGFLAYKEKILANKLLANKKRLMLITALLLLVIVIFSIIAVRNNKTEETILAQNDSLQQVAQKGTSGNKKDSFIIVDGNNPIPPQPENKTPIFNDPVKEIPLQEDNLNVVKNEITVKEKPRRTTKNPSKDAGLNPAENKESEKTVEPKPVEKKEIYISSQVVVNLALKGSPDMNQKKKAEQPVSFSVTKPVYYDGVLIVRQGATASGALTIGRKRTDIEIYNVEGANGNRIPLRSEAAHGRRDDIESNKTFTAVIPSGTRISL